MLREPSREKKQSLNFVYSFSELAEKESCTYSTKALRFQVEPATLFHAKQLNINIGDLIYYTKRVHYLDTHIYSVEIGYLPIYLFPDLSIEILSKSKYDYIRK